MTTNKQLKRYSLASLIAGYLLAGAFIILIFNMRPVADVDTPVMVDEPQVVEVNSTIIETEIVYVDRFTDRYVDHLDGVVVDQPHVAVVRDSTVVSDTNLYDERYNENNWRHDRVVGARVDVRDTNVGRYRHDRGHKQTVDNVDRHVRHGDGDVVLDDTSYDAGFLDRRIAEIEQQDKSIGLDVRRDDLDLKNLVPVSDDDELGEIALDVEFGNDLSGIGAGAGGQLYAYNYPSQGVGAGIGASAVGAGSGAGAGIGAGVGEGLLDGKTVPTLGGVGTYSMPGGGDGAVPGVGGGSGGLVAGSGAGGAAGLMTGYVKPGMGTGPGAGPGGGAGGGYNYDHLPKDGALHIMMHVDGSGSILNTRKQLDIMRNTILKDALLPYYNNDEQLYNRRVTIVSNSGERTLRFFTEAADKDNVLAIAFQDEAQPAYHLPNFNKKPEDHYMDDLTNLKASLNGYHGVYRGVMFQVDRGKTFAKSFKEFVGNAFRGEGYLSENSLVKYYRDNNTDNIRNKDGVVFSDEYHAKDAGDPQYYLDLILKASGRVGLDLNIHGGGLTDGEHVSE